MNFLAHAVLSGDTGLLLVGNFIGDTVRGSEFKLLPDEMQSGVLLHRAIDSFTDSHPVVLESKILLREHFGKYAGVVADVYYDHFLAADFEKHHNGTTLDDYAISVYKKLEEHFEHLTPRAQMIMPYLMKQNWLVSYAEIEGIASVLKRMSQRTKFESGMQLAGDELRKNYKIYEEHFLKFWPDLVNFAAEKRVSLLNHLK